MTAIQCPFCEVSTGGEHEADCPNAPKEQPKTARYSEGWICPRCGKIHAPWVAGCDCQIAVETGDTNETSPQVTSVHNWSVTVKGVESPAEFPFDDWEREQMKDPEFREAAEKLEPAFQVARLRMQRGWSQKKLARKVGLKKSTLKALEAGELGLMVPIVFQRLMQVLEGADG